MIFNNTRSRYLIAGIFNTIVGYFIVVILFKILNENLNIIIIGIIASIINIAISFTTYKVYVFKTKSNWLVECIKAYTVYGFTSILGSIILWIFVDYINLSIWISQALVIIFTILISYSAHSKFTFKNE